MYSVHGYLWMGNIFVADDKQNIRQDNHKLIVDKPFIIIVVEPRRSASS